MRNRSQGNPAKDFAGSRRRKKGVDPSQDRDHRVVPEGTAPPEELAVLFALGTDGHADDPSLPMLHELAELARTAEIRVVGRLYQRRASPDSAATSGSGKAKELAARVQETGANLVICDDDLSPAQVRNLEEVVNVRVVDRSELILDIFARHARTQQARLQVELAQLQYEAPRLKRMWTHLSRIVGVGGIASRGPGEKQLEIDRRLDQAQIEDLRSRARRDRGAARSPGARPVGRVQGGPRRLHERRQVDADEPADRRERPRRRPALRDARHAHAEARRGRGNVRCSSRTRSGSSTSCRTISWPRSTRRSRRSGTRTCCCTSSTRATSTPTRSSLVVRAVLADLGVSEIDELVVLNKIDLAVDRAALEGLRGRLAPAVLVSAMTGAGLDSLTGAIR